VTQLWHKGEATQLVPRTLTEEQTVLRVALRRAYNAGARAATTSLLVVGHGREDWVQAREDAIDEIMRLAKYE
jgi:hypothetical protein